MRKLTISRSDFELAFGLSSEEATAYLDTETGDVLYVTDDALRRLDDTLSDGDTLEAVLAQIESQPDLTEWNREQIRDAACVEWGIEGRYLALPKQDSREEYREMQAFIGSLEDEHLRELFDIAIDGRGAFRRFKDVLYRYPEAQEDWFKFRDDREQRRMMEWFASEGIEPEFE